MISKNNNGWIKIHRKLLDSELWLMKPVSWKVIWVYILFSVNHEAKAGFQRGEGYFNFSIERDLIGKDITKDQIKSFLQYARGSGMIDTRRTTRGLRLKVLNYNVYQSDERETTTRKTPNGPRENHERTTPINKNVRMEEDKNNTNTSDVPSQDVVDIIDNFGELNQSYKKWYGNKTQRASIERLIGIHGKDKIIQVIKVLPQSNRQPFLPTITSPLELEDRWAKLEAGLVKLKAKSLSGGRGLA